MPLTHTRTFRVRYYECDAYGHLNNANYLRLMQETAFDASAAAGYDLARYEQIGRHWLIRATEIEYLRQVRYGDALEVKTWVADFRRASSRRMYEFRLAGAEELAARGHSDWVLLGDASGQPVRVPAEMGAAFFPEGLPAAFPARAPFPSAPTPPPGVFKMRQAVRWRDIDGMQHVNNAVYLEYLDECGMRAIAAQGWPWTRMREAGFAIMLRKHQIQYHQPARLDDELEISTWLSNIRRSSATRHYTICRATDQARLVQVHTLGVWVELATGRPVRIPEAMLVDFGPQIVEA